MLSCTATQAKFTGVPRNENAWSYTQEERSPVRCVNEVLEWHTVPQP